MPGAIDILREVLSLTKSVSRLEKEFERTNDWLKELNDRISRVENSSEVTVEKSKAESARLVAEMHSGVVAKLQDIESRMQSFGAHRLSGPNGEEED